MELNTDKLTGESLKNMLKLVEERDGIDKELADLGTQRTEFDAKAKELTDKRTAVSQKINEAAGVVVAPATAGASAKAPRAKGKKGGKTPGKGRGPGKKAVPHGSVGDTILKVLRDAGTKGASIKFICSKFNLREDTVGKWLHTHMKNSKSGLKRPSRGQYVLSE